jgi:hypothetical protein
VEFGWERPSLAVMPADEKQTGPLFLSASHVEGGEGGIRGGGAVPGGHGVPAATPIHHLPPTADN